MIVAGLVAALVVGPSLLVHGLIWLMRRRLRPAPPRPVDLETTGVAILIVAQDESDRVLDALAAAREVVPAEHVHLVSNGSSDGTADLAHRLGAQVVETLGTLTTTGAVAAGIQAFHLLDRFAYVLVLDVDTRLAPGHLERALPLFADPTVAAVDARIAPDWLPPRRILAAYRARRYVLTQSFGRGRGGPPATVAHGLPGIGRLYRTGVLARLELDPPGLVEPDLDLTMQLYRRRLGRVALCPGAPAVMATSLKLREHRRLTHRAITGLWQTRRRGRTGPALYAQLVELALAAAVVTLVPLSVVALALPVEWPPLAEVRSVVGPVELALGLVLADFLLTAATALATRQPRYLLAGLLFPLLRVVDAVTVLRASLRRHPVPTTRAVHVPEPVQRIVLPVQREAPERPRRTRRPRRWWLAAGWALWVAVAGAAVARVVVTLPTLPASIAENELVQAAYARFAGIADQVPTVPHTLAATDFQLAGYTWLASPFDRHASVLTSARELSVVALVVLLVALLLLTVALRLHPLATAAAAAVLAAAGPAVAVLGAVGPGLVTAAWLGLAAVSAVWIGMALVRDRLLLFTLAGLLTICTGIAAVATTPLVIIPVGIGVATWLWFLEFERYEPDTTWRGHAAVVLFATGGIAALLWRADLMLAPTGGVLAGTQRPALLAAITVAAGGALVVKRIRPLAMGTLTGVGLAVGFGAQADALLPVVVAASAVVVAMLLDTAVRSPTPVVSGGLAAALTVAAAVTGLLIVPPVAPRAEHAALATWIGNQVAAGGTVTVPSDTWADLHRDLGRQDPRTVVRRAGERPAEGMVVQHGPADGGFLLGHFGTLTLVTTHLDPAYLDPAPRAAAGAQLARNSRLTASTQARNALLAGRVDMRAMAVLAGLCAENDITLVRTANSPHERGSRLPDRTVVVSTSDGPTGRQGVLDWLSAQEAPYAPATTRRTPEGVAISWRLPEPSDGATE